MDKLTGTQVLIALLVLIFGPGGATYVGVRSGLNGARADIKRTADTCERMETKINAHGERLARVETRVDNLEDAA